MLLGLTGMAYKERDRIGKALDPYPGSARTTPAVTFVRAPRVTDEERAFREKVRESEEEALRDR